jgi:hypothetical protein
MPSKNKTTFLIQSRDRHKGRHVAPGGAPLRAERGGRESIRTPGPVRSSIRPQQSSNQNNGWEQHRLNPPWRDEHV